MAKVSLLTAATLVAAAGCSRNHRASSGSRDNSTALYGQPTGHASASMPRVRPFDAQADGWKRAPFSFVQTELSPATLYHSSTKFLSLFTHLAKDGLGAPAFAAYGADGGPRIVKNGNPMEPSAMNECWVLVWFAGAQGWTNWDSPWVLFLQHRPVAMDLDADGLHFEFKEASGDTVLMPLFGYFKPPLEGHDVLAQHGLPSKQIKTWQWSKLLPRDVLMRVRYWASALREFPLYCEDSFSVDRARDTVTIRQRFHWHSMDDDWQTKHLKLAPVSPPLALAARDQQFPVEFSRRVMDLDLFTPYGPYMGVEGVDSFDATFRVLQYVNETEAPNGKSEFQIPNSKTDQRLQTLAGTNAVLVQAALARLRQVAHDKFRRPDNYQYDHGGLGNFCWAIQGDLWYAKALPFYDEATRTNALASLRKYFHEDVLVTNRFVRREFPKGSGRTYAILEGPGLGSGSALGDAGKFSANLLETLWAYAHFTGDWDLVKERWPLVKQLFCTPAEARWVSFGRDAIAELGDEAAPCLAFARLAYKVGDLDSYNYACYMFARELVHHWIKQRGAEYFRRHQPWHSMEFMDEEVYLTQLWGDTAGWQIDGPKYPAKTGERQYQNRWVRFKNEDVGRFYRDDLKGDVRHELDRWQSRWDASRRYINESHSLPSLVQLRSLLLNESPEELARVAMPNQFGGPPSGVLGSCLGMLRTSQPMRWVRLIPSGEPSPFVPGLEREVSGPSLCLAQSVQWEVRDEKTRSTPTWPEATWWGWKTPTGHRWTFGQVTPTRQGTPVHAQAVPLNWNAQAVIYSWP